ncbi:hypothetical protein ABK046_05020 [Streptomyces caeruleatus]
MANIESGGKVVLFRDRNYLGPGQSLVEGSYDSSDLTVGNDKTRSVEVPPGLRVRLYEHWHFQGAHLDVDQDVPDLGEWDKRASSVVVYKAGDPPPKVTQVVLYEGTQLGGSARVFDLFFHEQSRPEVSLGSALIPDGMVLRVYKGKDFGPMSGDFSEYFSDVMDLGPRAPMQYSFKVYGQG